MRGAGACDCATGAAGFAAMGTGGWGGAAGGAAATGGATTGGLTGRGGIGIAGGVATDTGGWATGAAGTENVGLTLGVGTITLGGGGGGAGTETDAGGGIGAGVEAMIVGPAAAGRVGRASAVAGACCLRMAFRTSPGLEICERSILVLIASLSTRLGRECLAAFCASPAPRKYARNFSASCSSTELECVFFSVTPTSGSASRMALLLTSSSLARSLIRILLIRLFFSSVLSR